MLITRHHLGVMMRRQFSTVAAAAVLFAAACNDSPTEPGQIAGTYQLQTVNGATPPVTVFQTTDYRLDVLSAVLILNTDLTYALASNLREIVGGVPEEFTETEFGTWVVTSFGVSLRDSQGFSTSAQIQGNALIIEEGGLRLVFAR